MEAAIKQKRVTIWKDFMVTREVWGKGGVVMMEKSNKKIAAAACSFT